MNLVYSEPGGNFGVSNGGGSSGITLQNPIEGNLKLFFSDNARKTGELTLRIFSLEGELMGVWKFQPFELEKEISLDKMPSGVYFIQINDGSKMEIFKVIKS